MSTLIVYREEISVDFCPQKNFSSTAESLLSLELVSIVPLGLEYNKHISVLFFSFVPCFLERF